MSEEIQITNLTTTAHSITPQENQEQSTTYQTFLQTLFSIIPAIFMFGTFIYFTFDQSLKLKVLSIFQNIENLTFQDFWILILIGSCLTIISAPLMIFEMALGYVFKYFQALYIAVLAKFIGELFCFFVSRYIFKDCVYEIFKEKDTFKLMKKSSEKYPWVLSNVIRANVLFPLFVINFGSGLFNFSVLQFSIPAIVWGTFYACFTVYFGSQFHDMEELLKSTKHPKANLLTFDLILGVISLIIILIVVLYSNKLISDMKEEIEQENQQKKLEKDLFQLEFGKKHKQSIDLYSIESLA